MLKLFSVAHSLMRFVNHVLLHSLSFANLFPSCQFYLTKRMMKLSLLSTFLFNLV